MVDHANNDTVQQTDKILLESSANENHFKNFGCRRYFRAFIARRFTCLKVGIARINRNVRKVDQMIERHNKELCQCFYAVKSCQEQTAKVLNSEMERHAINPAIETIAVLVNELIRLERLANELLVSGAGIVSFVDELKISAQIARDKLEYLGIVEIRPSRGDVLDTKLHSAISCEITGDGALHGAISGLVAAGFTYRGKVLKQAQVSVFKYDSGHIDVA